MTASLVAGCAGSPIADAIVGPEKLAQQDDAYCRSIGARGSDYTACRLFMTKQRDDRHTAARMAIGDAFQSAGEAMQRNRQTTCTTTGPYTYRSTTCY
jgi:hypothetical protein